MSNYKTNPFYYPL